MLMLELCLQSGLGEGVMQALPGAEQSYLEEERSVSTALTLTLSPQADKNELERVQMSRARRGRWGSAALQMRECASDMFWRTLKGQASWIFKSASGEAAGLCVLEEECEFVCLDECWATTCSMKWEFWRAALRTAPVAAGRCGVGLVFI